MPWARRKDSNSKAIEEALTANGWLVVDTSRLPAFVDLMAIKGSRIEFCEVKDGAKARSRQAYKPSQVKLHAALLRAGVLVKTLRCVEDAMRL